MCWVLPAQTNERFRKVEDGKSRCCWWKRWCRRPARRKGREGNKSTAWNRAMMMNTCIVIIWSVLFLWCDGKRLFEVFTSGEWLVLRPQYPSSVSDSGGYERMTRSFGCFGKCEGKLIRSFGGLVGLL